MSSTSTTVPPPAIGWNVHDSARPLALSGSAVVMSPACEFSISETISLPLAAEIEPAPTQAATMSGALAPRCTRSSDRRIISLKRWFMTASRPSAPNMHRPCGMLFKRGVELAGQRRLALARKQRADENRRAG